MRLVMSTLLLMKITLKMFSHNESYRTYINPNKDQPKPQRISERRFSGALLQINRRGKSSLFARDFRNQPEWKTGK